MDTADAMKALCISIAMGFVTGYIVESILELLAHSSPLNVAIVCHFLLSFILVVLYFGPQAFIRRPGRLYWRHRFRSAEEALDFIKLLVFWWLVLFNFAVCIEGLAFFVYALPFLMGWRHEHCDDPEYIPLLMRLNWVTFCEVGRWLGWHMENYWFELERAFLELVA